MQKCKINSRNFREQRDREPNDSTIYIFVISATSKTDLPLKLFPKEQDKSGALTHPRFDPNQVIVFISKTEETKEDEINKIKAEVKAYFGTDQSIVDATGRKFKNLKDLYVVTAKDLGPAVYSVEDTSEQKNIFKNVAHHMLNCIGKTLNPDNKETSGVSTVMYNSSEKKTLNPDNKETSGVSTVMYSPSEKKTLASRLSNLKSRIIEGFGTIRRIFSVKKSATGGRRRRSVKRKKTRRSKKSRNIR